MEINKTKEGMQYGIVLWGEPIIKSSYLHKVYLNLIF